MLLLFSSSYKECYSYLVRLAKNVIVIQFTLQRMLLLFSSPCKEYFSSPCKESYCYLVRLVEYL